VRAASLAPAACAAEHAKSWSAADALAAGCPAGLELVVAASRVDLAAAAAAAADPVAPWLAAGPASPACLAAAAAAVADLAALWLAAGPAAPACLAAAAAAGPALAASPVCLVALVAAWCAAVVFRVWPFLLVCPASLGRRTKESGCPEAETGRCC